MHALTIRTNHLQLQVLMNASCNLVNLMKDNAQADQGAQYVIGLETTRCWKTHLVLTSKLMIRLQVKAQHSVKLFAKQMQNVRVSLQAQPLTQEIVDYLKGDASQVGDKVTSSTQF